MLALVVFTTQKGKRREEQTLIPIQQRDVSSIIIEWNPKQDAIYDKQLKEIEKAAEAKTESAPARQAESAAPDTESAPPTKELKRTVLTKVTEGEDSYWLFEEPLRGARVDPVTADSLEKRLGFLESSRTVEFEKGETKDPHEFGLDEPMLTVTVQGVKGKAFTLNVGRKQFQNESERFAQIEGSDQIVVVQNSLVTDLTKDPKDMRDKSLFVLKPDEVKVIEVSRSPASASVESAPSEPKPSNPYEDEYTKAKVATDSFTATLVEPRTVDEDPRWELSGEGTGKGDANGCRGFASDLTTKRADKIVVDTPTEEQLAEHGLDRPAQTYMVTGRRKHQDAKRPFGSDTTQTLYIGSKDTDGSYSVRVDWKPEIMVIKSTDFDALQKKFTDLRDKSLHDFQDKDIKSIRTTRGGFSTTLVHQPKEKKKWVLADGEEVKEAAASSLSSSVEYLNAREFIEDNPTDLAKYGLDEPRATIEVVPRSGKTVTIYIGAEVQGKAGQIYARSSDNKAVVTIDSYIMNSIPAKLSDIAVVAQPEKAEKTPAPESTLLDIGGES